MNFQTRVDLLPYNTFHFSCIAEYFVIIQSQQDRQKLITSEIFANSKRLILGGGSNMLLTTDHFDGLVIKNEIMGKGILLQDETSVNIKVGAGENRNNFVIRTIDQGYHGLENLISIPGTVGAAPMQNIGAYGVEVGDLISQVEYLDLTGNIHRMSKEDCQFGYRESVFKHELKDKTCISSVTFQLSKYNAKTYQPNIHYGAISGHLIQLGKDLSKVIPQEVADTVAYIRASKLPDRTKIGTAGSFFKNPIIPEQMYITLKESHPDLVGHPVDSSPLVKEGLGEIGQLIKLSAGQLIDLSGLKGLDRGSVGTYHHHALILIHSGGGKGENIVELCHYIQEKVFEKFKVLIEPEVNFID